MPIKKGLFGPYSDQFFSDPIQAGLFCLFLSPYCPYLSFFRSRPIRIRLFQSNFCPYSSYFGPVIPGFCPVQSHYCVLKLPFVDTTSSSSFNIVLDRLSGSVISIGIYVVVALMAVLLLGVLFNLVAGLFPAILPTSFRRQMPEEPMSLLWNRYPKPEGASKRREYL
jgi:hypothetical protein